MYIYNLLADLDVKNNEGIIYTGLTDYSHIDCKQMIASPELIDSGDVYLITVKTYNRYPNFFGDDEEETIPGELIMSETPLLITANDSIYQELNKILRMPPNEFEDKYLDDEMVFRLNGDNQYAFQAWYVMDPEVESFEYQFYRIPFKKRIY